MKIDRVCMQSVKVKHKWWSFTYFVIRMQIICFMSWLKYNLFSDGLPFDKRLEMTYDDIKSVFRRNVSIEWVVEQKENLFQWKFKVQVSDKNVHQTNITIKDSLRHYGISISSSEYIVPTRN